MRFLVTRGLPIWASTRRAWERYDEARWDRAFRRSQDVLARMADEALEEARAGRVRLMEDVYAEPRGARENVSAQAHLRNTRSSQADRAAHATDEGRGLAPD